MTKTYVWENKQLGYIETWRENEGWENANDDSDGDPEYGHGAEPPDPPEEEPGEAPGDSIECEVEDADTRYVTWVTCRWALIEGNQQVIAALDDTDIASILEGDPPERVTVLKTGEKNSNGLTQYFRQN